MSRRSRSFFSELVDATTKRFYMMVNYPLSRGLGNIAKVYLITCCQSTCAKLKKYEFCPVGRGGIAHIIHILSPPNRDYRGPRTEEIIFYHYIHTFVSLKYFVSLQGNNKSTASMVGLYCVFELRDLRVFW